MRLDITFAETEQQGTLDESDAVLNPDTTWLDVKGLIKMWTGEAMSKQVLVVNGEEIDDSRTLGDVGLYDQDRCDKAVIVLHLQDCGTPMTPAEFSHEDFLKAQRLAGKVAPVSAEERKEEEVRRERRFAQIKAKSAPRQRPAALNSRKSMSHLGEGSVRAVLEKGWHGMRKEGTDKLLEIDNTGITQPCDHEGNPVDPFEYWDLRIAEDPVIREKHGPGEVVCELFYFGFHMPGKKATNGKAYPWVTDEAEFKQRVMKSLAKNGLPVPEMDHPLRDAGCLYPLVAVAARFSEDDAWELGTKVFDDFGKEPPKQPASGAKKSGCAQQ